MPRYLALFGSINVGGNRLAMADLRAAFAAEGFANVETVVASGNVLFDRPELADEALEVRLAGMLRDRFGIESFAVVRSREEIAEAISGNPFAADGAEKFVHICFLSDQPAAAQFERLVADHAGRGPERLALGRRALYVDYADGVGTSKLTNAFIERRLGCRGTARNIRSLKRMVEKMN